MNRMKHGLRLLTTLFLFQSSASFATHLMGGEITWTCLGTGQYVFHMKLYRDCNGITEGPTVTLSTDVPGLSTGIVMSRISQTDNSPVCNSNGPAITCAGATTGLTVGAVEEYVYQSFPVSLSGVPPAGGWTFWYSDCCRNSAIDNLAIPGAGFTLRAKMFSFRNKDANPCYDNSPVFYEPSRTVLCGGYPFVFNHNAKDAELDSLAYEWDHPLNDNSSSTVFTAQPIQFLSPYTYDSPLPGPAQDPRNVPPVLDRSTGEVSYTSFTTGNYVFVLKVSAYRCGEKVAEIFREIQEVITSCPDIIPGFPNNPPMVVPPFIDSSGNATLWVDTVHAGDLVSFNIHSADFDQSATLQFQYMHIIASGMEFDPTFTNSQGPCAFPPCATLTPSPINYSSQVTANIAFNWQTPDCTPFQNGICSANSTTYFFNFTLIDDFCPIPAQSYRAVKIVVIGDSVPSILQSGDTLFSSIQSSFYQWYMNDIPIPGANLNYFVPAQNAFYHLETTFPNGCSTASPSIPFVVTYIRSLDEIVFIDINPNPFSQTLHVVANGNKLNHAEIVIMNVRGSIVLLKNYDCLNGKLDYVFDFSLFPAGIYLMQFKTVDAQKTFKLVKYN